MLWRWLLFQVVKFLVVISKYSVMTGEFRRRWLSVFVMMMIPEVITKRQPSSIFGMLSERFSDTSRAISSEWFSAASELTTGLTTGPCRAEPTSAHVACVQWPSSG